MLNLSVLPSITVLPIVSPNVCIPCSKLFVPSWLDQICAVVLTVGAMMYPSVHEVELSKVPVLTLPESSAVDVPVPSFKSQSPCRLFEMSVPELAKVFVGTKYTPTPPLNISFISPSVNDLFHTATSSIFPFISCALVEIKPP